MRVPPLVQLLLILLLVSGLARWLAPRLGVSRGIVALVLMLLAYAVVSRLLNREERRLGIVRSRELRRAIWIGTAWINGPAFVLLMAPLLTYMSMGGARHLILGLLLLGFGFLLSVSWWSVNVSLWRRWAANRGLDAAELQYHGESSNILQARGSFFERIEYDNLRRRLQRGVA
jgi:hypothetical protein